MGKEGGDHEEGGEFSIPSNYTVLLMHTQNGCVAFDAKCDMPETYCSNWCVIGYILNVSQKDNVNIF